MFVKQELPAFVDKKALSELAKQVVDLSKKGLQKRGYGEDIILEYGRLNLSAQL